MAFVSTKFDKINFSTAVKRKSRFFSSINYKICDIFLQSIDESFRELFLRSFKEISQFFTWPTANFTIFFGDRFMELPIFFRDFYKTPWVFIRQIDEIYIHIFLHYHLSKFAIYIFQRLMVILSAIFRRSSRFFSRSFVKILDFLLKTNLRISWFFERSFGYSLDFLIIFAHLYIYIYMIIWQNMQFFSRDRKTKFSFLCILLTEFIMIFLWPNDENHHFFLHRVVKFEIFFLC